MRRLPHGSAVGCLQEPLVCRSLFQSAVAPREELNLQTADRGFSVRCATTVRHKRQSKRKFDLWWSKVWWMINCGGAHTPRKLNISRRTPGEGVATRKWLLELWSLAGSGCQSRASAVPLPSCARILACAVFGFPPKRQRSGSTGRLLKEAFRDGTWLSRTARANEPKRPLPEAQHRCHAVRGCWPCNGAFFQHPVPRNQYSTQST
jgi:hypothetical protein